MLETFAIGEGTVLADRYEVIERLGSGGMATVFLAEDKVLGRRVAVKRMHTESGQTGQRRFRREARLGATLSHPNVVTVFDTHADEDGVLIVMEYVAGETLADAIDRGPLEAERAIEIIRGVAAALDHAHARGIVHRDVKPANVLLGENGTVKLADLGIATAAEATRITTATDIVGTLAYIAPERLESSTPGGPESDVYGLAVLAYEALGGEPLNRGSTPAEVVHRAATGPAPDLRDVWPGAPQEAANALEAGMRRDPAQRPGSAGELAERLARAFEPGRGERTAELPLPPPPPGPDAPPSAARRPGPGVALAAIVAIGLAGLAALVVAIAAGDGDGPAREPALTSVADGDSSATEDRGAQSGGEEAGSAAPPAEESAPEDSAAPPPQGEQAAALTDDPEALNEQGYDLIQAGRPDQAVPILQRAVDSYPEGTTDLNHAYALFNLGNALRLAGRPEEAIPILEERLQIPNQRGIVKRELEAARADAGE